MKKCLVCLAHIDEAAPTCPLCGEASWGASSLVSDDPDDVEVEPSDVTPDTTPRTKRGRRGA